MKYNLSESCYRFFSTLSTPSRLGILEVLRESPKSVSEIVNILSQEQSMISHNLKALAKCKFVFVEKRGKERIYSLNRETMEPIFKTIGKHLEEHCYRGEGCSGTRNER